MCEINWEIIQKFVGCLIWPIIIIILFIIFRKQLTFLINRIAHNSEKIDVAGFLSIHFKAIEKLKDDKKQGKPLTDAQADIIISSTVAIQIEGIKLLGEDYIKSSFDQRRIIECRINEYSIGLTIDDIIPLITSKNTGHKIAAAIALELILDKSKTDPADNELLKKFIKESLNNSSSFLRYECLQLVFQSNKLKEEFKTQLEEMKMNDKNSAIRNIIKIFVK